jgi:hypothetical protein
MYRLPQPRKEPQYQLNIRLDEPHSESGNFGEEENVMPLPGSKLQTVQPAAQSLCQVQYPGSKYMNFQNMTVSDLSHILFTQSAVME